MFVCFREFLEESVFRANERRHMSDLVQEGSVRT